MAECKKGFLHGGDLQGAAEKSGRRPSELLDFSANINPLGMPPGVREAVLESLEQSLFYPDPFCRRLRKNWRNTRVRKQNISYAAAVGQI